MTKLLLANLASPANPGDQAILRGTLKLLRNCFGQSQLQLTLVTRAISERAIYEAMGCRVLSGYPCVEKMDSESLPGRVAAIPGAFADPGALREAVRTAEAVFLAGGAYLYSYRFLMPGLTYLSHLSPVYWARRFKKPLVMLPQSFGPFRSGLSRLLFDAAVRAAGLVFYREDISGAWLKEQYSGSAGKFNFLPDLALYLSAADILGRPLHKNSKTNRVGVTVRQWRQAGKDEQAYVEKLADALTQFHSNHGVSIRIIVQVQAKKRSEGDESISRRLEDILVDRIGRGGVELCQQKPYFQLSDLCRLYEECEMLISMRLHSALLGFILGRPALVVGYQHKAEGVLKSLNLGNLYASSYDEVESGDLGSAIERLWQERETWSRRIEEILAKMRGSLEADFKRKIQSILK